MASELESVYLDACAIVRCRNVWCSDSWHTIVRLSPLPQASNDSLDVTPYAPSALEAAATAQQLPDWHDKDKDDPAVYLQLLCRLFPTSAAVGQVALQFLQAGCVKTALRVMQVALTHGSAWPSTWQHYLNLLRLAGSTDDSTRQALQQAVAHVGMDPRSGAIWEQFVRSRCADASRVASDAALVDAARDAAATAMTLPLRPDDVRDATLRNALGKLEVAVAQATGASPREGLPAVVLEAQILAHDVGAKLAHALPSEVSFPSPRCDLRDVERWRQWMAYLNFLRTNPSQFTSAELLESHVRTALQQLRLQFCRQAAPHLVVAFDPHSGLGSRSAVKSWIDECRSYVVGKQASLLLDALAADLLDEPAPTAPRDASTVSLVHFFKTQRDQYVVSDTADIQKALKKALRDAGKASVAAGLPHWQKFDEWATTEITALHDATLIPDITRRALTVGEAAAKQRSIPAAAANLTQLGIASARWARLRGNEADIRANLERTVQLLDSVRGNGASHGLVKEAWSLFAEAELALRGLRDGERVARRQHRDHQSDGDVRTGILSGAVPWGTASLQTLVSQLTVSSGGHVCLTPNEQSVYRIFADVEQSSLATKAMKDTGLINPEQMQLPPHSSTTAVGRSGTSTVGVSATSGWTTVKVLPHNPTPSRLEDDHNSDELCAPRSMKPHRKLILDASANAAQLFAVQRAANPDAEFFGPSSYAPDEGSNSSGPGTLIDGTRRRDANTVRMPVQLQTLVDVCRGLPTLHGTDVRTEWIEQFLARTELNLRYEPAPATHNRRGG